MVCVNVWDGLEYVRACVCVGSLSHSFSGNLNTHMCTEEDKHKLLNQLLASLQPGPTTILPNAHKETNCINLGSEFKLRKT